MLRIILKDLAVVLAVAVLLVVTFPILADEIDESRAKGAERVRLVDVLPENRSYAWAGELPDNQDKVKIKKIVIDLSEQKLYRYENDEVLDEHLISTGLPGMDTPTGILKVENKNPRAWSHAARLWMPFWLLIDSGRGIGIHELPEWPNGHKEGENSLGHKASHGCVRLGVGAAQIVYEWAEVGTQVIITK